MDIIESYSISAVSGERANGIPIDIFSLLMGLPVAKIRKALQVTLQGSHRRLVALRRDGHGITGPRLRPKYYSHDGVRDEIRAGGHPMKRFRIETLAHIDLAKVGKSTKSQSRHLPPEGVREPASSHSIALLLTSIFPIQWPELPKWSKADRRCALVKWQSQSW